MLLVSSPRFAEHTTPPGHPERPERAGVFDRVAAAGATAAARVAPRPATREELLRVHDAAYLDAMAATAGRAVMLDADTFTSPESVRDRAARRRRGGAGGRTARSAPGEPAFALVRPPGHHAERDTRDGLLPVQQRRGRGGARAAPRGLSRVAIVDIDVHHGNGTQCDVLRRSARALRVDASVPVLSRHRARPTRAGAGAGAGLHVQRAAARPARPTPTTCRRLPRIVGPRSTQFAPELLLVSAGFDAHERRSAGVDARDDRRLCAPCVRDPAADAAARRLAVRWRSSPKGGYDLEALDGDCLDGEPSGVLAHVLAPTPARRSASAWI